MSKITITLLLSAIVLLSNAQHVNVDWMARLITDRVYPNPGMLAGESRIVIQVMG